MHAFACGCDAALFFCVQQVSTGQWVGLLLGSIAGIGAAVVATCLLVSWCGRRWRARRRSGSGGSPSSSSSNSKRMHSPPPGPILSQGAACSDDPAVLPTKKQPPQEDGDAEFLRTFYGKKLAHSPPTLQRNRPLAWSMNPLAEGAGEGRIAAKKAGVSPHANAAARDAADATVLPAWRRPVHGSQPAPPQ